MEEIKFKPSTKNNVFYLIFGIILVITLILSPLGLIFILVGIVGLITKQFYTFTIKDNEIEIKYQFITKMKKVYRIDQITSITLERNLVQKWFNLGSIKFGIFGKTNQLYQNQNQNGQTQLTNQIFFDIENDSKIFNILCEKLKITENKIEYEDKPSLKPVNFWKNLWLSLFLIFTTIGITMIFALGTDIIDLGIFLIFIPIGILFLILFIIMLIEKKKFKSMRYSIKESSLDYLHDYFFSKKYIKIPLRKITNTEINKNLISYKLFKIGIVKIFTGGDNDPTLNDLNKFSEFQLALSQKLDNKVPLENSQAIKSIKNNSKTNIPEFKTKPGASFFLGTFFFSSLIFLPITFVGFNFFPIVGIISIIIYLLIIIGKYILWKNTSYEFYEDKVIDKSGIININTKEIRFKNIKYISLRRSFFFNRILNQGSIYIYTAGTGSMDNAISAIKEYETVYKELKKVILEENN